MRERKRGRDIVWESEEEGARNEGKGGGTRRGKES